MTEIRFEDMSNLEGKEYWRSLDQLAETPEFKQFLEREFPEGASEMTNPITRRNFLALMGASIGLAGLAGCRRPVEKIIPYVTAPEEVIPGVAQHYATTMPFANSAFGLVVESHEGRPTKMEGNKLHPSSLGGTNLYMQAAVLGLYDPDRSNRVVNNGSQSSWNDFVAFWRNKATEMTGNSSAGLAILCEQFSSPTLSRLKDQILKEHPQATWVTWEPVSDENIYGGTELAAGRRLRPLYDFSKADIVLSLDCDFLQTESENVNNATGFTAKRRIENESDSMNRLYTVESCFSLTGAMADHRLRLKSGQIAGFTAALAAELRRQGLDIDGVPDIAASTKRFDAKWLKVVASDLLGARGKSLIVAGRRQHPEAQALVFAINYALGNVGKTVNYYEFTDATTSRLDDLVAFVKKMKSGEIDTLIMIGGNPVYNAPIDLDFENALSKVINTVHLSDHVDETSQLCSWHIPQTHFLEIWEDTRSADGTLSVIQPLIAPMFSGHSRAEMLELISSGLDRRCYEIVRDTWRQYLPTLDLEKQWRKVLHDGLLADSASKPVTPDIDSGNLRHLLTSEKFAAQPEDQLEIVFTTSAKLFDGRFANSGWLQELPDPISKIAWDNAALMSHATAAKLGVKSKDLVRLSYKDRDLEIPAWILPGHADGSISVELGYGRDASGRVGNGVGANAYALRGSDRPDFDSGLVITRTGGRYKIANTQDHSSMEGRPIVREATLAYYRDHPDFAPDMVEHLPLKSLWQDRVYDTGYQWGMTIDLNVCTGCNACVVACQSENNIPVVGKDQVWRGREMQWIRTDRYFTGSVDDPRIAQQPVACVHCENAPCEEVCPVAATQHDSEGLNVMVYNRCIGTRYCSNNCPYKVRHFNFYHYTENTPETLKMANNPDVTVRSRGVMEKCTYCIQRIKRAEINAKDDNRQVKDGEIVTACQQACPVDAIVFGNINDPDSRVSKIKKQNRNYHLLAQLNTKPRTSYLARIRNPHPELDGEKDNEV
jgi:MoCo/4Fe-4S cofactor protein with predicted Tat translocation signal